MTMYFYGVDDFSANINNYDNGVTIGDNSSTDDVDGRMINDNDISDGKYGVENG